MEVELDVLWDSIGALKRAHYHNPHAAGPMGLGLYQPLAAALERLATWTQVCTLSSAQTSRNNSHISASQLNI